MEFRSRIRLLHSESQNALPYLHVVQGMASVRNDALQKRGLVQRWESSRTACCGEAQ